MKERKIWRNGIKIAWLLFNVISILIWLPSLDRLFTQDHVLTSRYISLDDGWDIVINDSSYQDVSLDDFRFEAVNIGDTITMKRKLPVVWGFCRGGFVGFFLVGGGGWVGGVVVVGGCGVGVVCSPGEVG